MRGLWRVGIYVPGGTAAYPSSVLMNAIPAKVAGVGELIMVTPPTENMSNDCLLYTSCVKEEKHLAAGEVRSLAFGDNNTVMVVELGPVSYTHLDVYKRQR